MAIAYEFWEDYEVLTVETPENIELRLPLAGFGPRFLALVVDSLIQAAAGTVLAVMMMAVTMSISNLESGLAMFFIALVSVLLVILIWLGYFVIFEYIWNGQTPGKRITGIRVVKRGGLPLNLRDVILRNLLRLADYLPSHGLVGMISFFASRSQQRLGDLVADTVVIKEFSRQLPFTWVGSADTGGGHSGISPQLSYVAGSYLTRAAGLATDVRLDMTSRIITALGYDAAPMSLPEREDYIAAVLQWQAGGAR